MGGLGFFRRGKLTVNLDKNTKTTDFQTNCKMHETG
jgi:hypothetical protein